MFTVRTRSVVTPCAGRAPARCDLAHGDVQTPAFVPLATRGAVKTLEPRDVEALGYEMVLGNTFHLFLAPGPELIAEFGGLNRFMRWERPIITDSGGFQVFSMGHGGVADEIKGRGRAAESDGAILAIEEEGVRFRSYVDGRERFIGPETSMAVQAALGSDIALVFDECTPFHVSRDYTARSTERTHRWLERCLRWHEQHGPPARPCTGSSRAASSTICGASRRAAVAASACDGIAIGGSLGQRQGADVRGRRLDDRRARAPRARAASPPARDRRDRRPDRGRRARGSTRSTARCRRGSAATAWRSCPTPRRAGGSIWPRAGGAESAEPILEGCPCPACAGGFTRAYLHYLLRAGELTALRLVTLHNLSFIARLMGDLRAAIDGERLPEVAAALRAGAPPGTATSCTG